MTKMSDFFELVLLGREFLGGLIISRHCTCKILLQNSFKEEESGQPITNLF